MLFAHWATFGDRDRRVAKDATGKLNSSRCDTWNESPGLQGRMKSAAHGSWFLGLLTAICVPRLAGGWTGV